MEDFNKLVPIDGENGEKRTISSLQIAEITGKAYCGVLKVIRKMDIMCVKITMKNIFSLFVCLKKCCTFVVRHFYIHTWFVEFLCSIDSCCLKYKQRFLRAYSPTSQYESVATWRNSLLFLFINF